MKTQKKILKPLFLSATALSLVVGGCASGPDPLQGWNRGAHSFNNSLDKNVVKPLAKGYQWITPDVVDQGVSNFFSNISDIGVTINDLLQFKLLQGGMDASRFVINSTIGLGGLVDVAEKVDLPKHNEDFGQTLGFWGVPSGPYLVLPIFGPSSVRDGFGRVGDALFNPLTYVSIFGGAAASAATAGSTVVQVTDVRADLLSTEQVVNEAANGSDKYEFIKNAYQQRREYLINDGKITDDDEYDVDGLNSEPSEGGDEKPAATNSGLIPNGPGAAPTQPLNPDAPIPTNELTGHSSPAPRHHVLDLSAPK